MSKKFNLSIIACVDMAGGIGRIGTIPWKCPTDLKRFVMLTKSTGNTTSIVIMGRKTFDSILKSNGKPLADRINIVITSSGNAAYMGTGVVYVNSFDSAVNLAKRMYDDANESQKPVSKVFVIGGSSPFEYAIKSPYLHKIFLSVISFPHNSDKKNADFGCDTFMFGDLENTQNTLQKLFTEFTQLPEERHNVKITYSKSSTPDEIVEADAVLTNYEFMRMGNPSEMKFLALISKILKVGILQPNRTNIPTISLFSKKVKFPLMYPKSSGIIGKRVLPLLTTKRVPYITVCNELIWFIRGEDNTKFLKEKGVKIWEGNTSREYLDSKGLTTYEEGQTGPIYGVQWRHWKTNPPNLEVDQLVELIYGIMTDPYSRRHVLTAWNVSDIDKMCLPPCHMTSVWKVEPEMREATALSRNNDVEISMPKYLSCHVLMRSADVFLGVPFNIASYATLTHLIAEICGLTAKTLAVDMVDCHIYQNHISQCEEQLSRDPICFPSLDFSTNINTLINEFNIGGTVTKNKIKWLLDIIGNKISGRDFIPQDYISWSTISAPMAV